MLTVQYARAFPEMRINATGPGSTATDFNGNNGTQTVQKGTDAIVDLATRGGGGPTGTFIDRSGVAPFQRFSCGSSAVSRRRPGGPAYQR
jgi:hypothetical protein